MNLVPTIEAPLKRSRCDCTTSGHGESEDVSVVDRIWEIMLQIYVSVKDL
ncbi:hypothetical protein DVH24_042517 [Malus domestica]|uniref:Uncharacterized protein n=1 Tax=Malus domestica TaxID=3750 RepID=A0A498JFX7_MALDO|nr:hypothetical protein DVH24_042517 [Malus domestica]